MAVIAEFTIPVEDFALSAALDQRPEMEFRVDSMVAQDASRVAPFVRATRGEFEGLAEILIADPSVGDVELLAETDGERFYRLVWTSRAEIIGYMVVEQGATVQQATAGAMNGICACFFPIGATLPPRVSMRRKPGFRLRWSVSTA